MNRRFIKKYYLDNTSTLLLPFFFGTLSLVIALQQVPSLSIKNLIGKDFFEAIKDLTTGICAALISAIAGLYGLLRNYICKKVEEENKKAKEQGMWYITIDKYNKNNSDIIPRIKQYEELKFFFDKTFEHKKYAFFVGKSGNGKSLLLKEFKDEKKEEVTIFSANNEGVNDYANAKRLGILIKESIDKNKNMTHHYLIFDQFEKALLKFDCFRAIIRSLKYSENTAIRFIFVCRKDKYADVYEELQNDISNQNDTYFLRVTEDEKQFMLDYIKDELHLSESGKRYGFFVHLLDGLCSGDVSMIELNIAIKYFKRTKKKKYEKMFKKNPYPLKEIIEECLKGIVSSVDPDLGMIIIYSLCCEEYVYGLTINDFKNLTFAPEETIEKILESLEDRRIIKKFGGSTKEIDGSKEFPYAMTHDYLIENFKKYCKNNISERIILNIDFYCKEKKDMELKEIKEIKEKKDKESTESSLPESPLSLYYKNAVEDKTSSHIITICLILLCIAVFVVCVLQEINGYRSIFFSNMEFERDYYIFALTVLAIGSAIFYVYHYLYYFAKIFFSEKESIEYKLCLLLIFLGMSSVILALLANEFWVTWIALVWLINAILHFTLSKKFPSNENVRSRLKGEGVLYTIVAFGLIGLNIWVLRYLSSSSIMYPWFGVFILFVFGAIRQHLNTDWILSKVGSFTSLCLKEKEEDKKKKGEDKKV